MQHREKLSGSGSSFPNCPWSWGPEDGKYATTGICHPGHEEEVSGDRSAEAPYHPRDFAGDEAGVAATPQPEGCSHVMGSIHNVLLRLPAVWRGCGPRGEQVRSDSAPGTWRCECKQLSGPPVSSGADQGVQNRLLSPGGYNLPGQGSWRVMPSSCGFGLHGQSRHRTGPVLQVYYGRFLTRDRFVEAIRRALTTMGHNCAHYAGHSFRIGAATTAARQGLQDSLIKTLGRWESTAYTLYIRTPREVLCSVAGTLTGPAPPRAAGSRSSVTP